jgi:hypothetical protein
MIGHDGRRIGVDEDDLEPLFLERLRRLRAGIVELRSLPDDDRAGTYYENSVEVGALRHLDLAIHWDQVSKRTLYEVQAPNGN